LVDLEMEGRGGRGGGGEDEEGAGEGEELQPHGPPQGEGEDHHHAPLQEEHGAGERALALGVPGDGGEGGVASGGFGLWITMICKVDLRPAANVFAKLI